MCPGEWAMTTPSRFALITASWGVTPQPQNTGTSSSDPESFPRGSSSLVMGASPHCGLSICSIPKALTASQPQAIGSPWVAENARVIPLTLGMSLALYGRIDTTKVLPVKTPAGHSGIAVRYMGTFRPRAVCSGGSPAAASEDSKLKEQPIKNAT